MDINIMGNKVVKRNNGRVGKGHAQSVVNTIRRAFDVAIADLDARGKPLPELMADALEQDTLGALNTISRFMPRDVDVNIGGGNFADALATAAEIMRSNEARPIIIDQETPGNNITDIDNNVTQKETSEN